MSARISSAARYEILAREEGVGKRRQEIRQLHDRARQAAEALKAHAEEVLEATQRIEDLTDGTPEWYPGMCANVEAQATMRQARALVRTLEQVDESTRENTNHASEHSSQNR